MEHLLMTQQKITLLIESPFQQIVSSPIPSVPQLFMRSGATRHIFLRTKENDFDDHANIRVKSSSETSLLLHYRSISYLTDKIFV